MRKNAPYRLHLSIALNSRMNAILTECSLTNACKMACANKKKRIALHLEFALLGTLSALIALAYPD
jgi:hypothetical protein